MQRAATVVSTSPVTGPDSAALGDVGTSGARQRDLELALLSPQALARRSSAW